MAPRIAKLSALTTNPSVVIVVLLMGIAVFWVWFGLTQRSIFQDEGISLLAAQGISDHGVPRAPSGYIYTRGYLPHYLVGGMIKVFGDGLLSIIVPSLLLGIGSLALVYVFVRDALRRPWLGIIAVAILLALSMQTLYATSPRMYMSLQFFTLLAAYSVWKGLAGNDRRWWILTFFAIAAAMFSHIQGVVLSVAIPFTLVAASWYSGRHIKSLITVNTMVGLAALLVLSAIATLYRPQDAMPQITAHSFATARILGVQLGFASIWQDGFSLTDAARYLVGFMPMAVIGFYAIASRQWRRFDPPIVFAVTLITVVTAFNMYGTSEPHARMWFFVLPFFAILAAVASESVLATRRFRIRANLNSPKYAFVAVALAILALAVVGWVLPTTAGGARAGQLLGEVVGPPCQRNNCDKSIKEHYSQLSRNIRPDDMIISSNPFVTHYYLGNVHGYLREKFVVNADGTVSTFDNLRDEYFGIPLIDDEDLTRLLSGPQRVWVVSGERALWISSPEARSVLKNSYDIFIQGEQLTTYVNDAPQLLRAAAN